MNAAIIVAAGSSRRMGFDKLYATLGERPVLAHTLGAFQEAPCIDRIVVVTLPERTLEVSELRQFYRLSKIADVIVGGGARHESVYAGLQTLPDTCEYVAVHDGARPLISQRDIDHCMQLAHEHGAAACARRITETVKRADARCQVTGSVDRTNLWVMETPQIIERHLLLRAYDYVLERHLVVTDEVSAVESVGAPVFLAKSRDPNIKITIPQDLELAHQLLTHPVAPYLR